MVLGNWRIFVFVFLTPRKKDSLKAKADFALADTTLQWLHRRPRRCAERPSEGERASGPASEASPPELGQRPCEGGRICGTELFHGATIVLRFKTNHKYRLCAKSKFGKELAALCTSALLIIYLLRQTISGRITPCGASGA